MRRKYLIVNITAVQFLVYFKNLMLKFKISIGKNAKETFYPPKICMSYAQRNRPTIHE